MCWVSLVSLLVQCLPTGFEPVWGKKLAPRGRLSPQAAVLEQQQKLAQRQEAERSAVRELDPSSEEAIANSSDMQLVFFGTSAQRPTKARCTA